MTAQSFPCSQCGAPEMAFDPTAQMLRCPYCENTAPVPAQAQMVAPVERAVGHGIQANAQGFGGQIVTAECGTCGARVSFGGVEISKHCDFCGSTHVQQQSANASLIRPESIVPFQVEPRTAQAQFKQWLGKLWFRPSSLKQMAVMGEIRGVYIPYWTFDARVASQWQAERGHHYYEETMRLEKDASGKQVKRKHRERKTRWEHASGHRQDHFDDQLVAASKGLPEKIAKKLKTFNTAQLVPYSPEFLAGWAAEEYAVSIEAALQEAKKQMDREVEKGCESDVGGDTVRGLSVRSQYSHETYKHILLPLFIATYRFNQKPYRFLVNGQTGEVQGEAPYSAIKIALFVMLMMFLIGGCLLCMTGALTSG